MKRKALVVIGGIALFALGAYICAEGANILEAIVGMGLCVSGFALAVGIHDTREE